MKHKAIYWTEQQTQNGAVRLPIHPMLYLRHQNLSMSMDIAYGRQMILLRIRELETLWLGFCPDVTIMSKRI